MPTLRMEEAGSTGKTRPLSTAVAQPAHEVLLRQRPLLEELLDQVLVVLRHQLDQLLAPGGGGLLDLLRAGRRPRTCRSGRRGTRRPCRGRGRPTPTNPFSSPRGMARGTTERPKALCSDSMRAPERGAVAVHAVDDDQARDLVVGGVAPDLLRLDLDAGHAVHHHDRGVGDAQGGPGLGEEVRVAGRVEEVQLRLAPLAVGDGGLQADLPLDLVGIEIGHGGAVVHAAQPVDRSHVEEHRGDQRRLPAASVADHGHVADGGWLVDLHASNPPALEYRAALGGRSFITRSVSTASAAAVLLGDGAGGGDGPARRGRAGRRAPGRPRPDHNTEECVRRMAPTARTAAAARSGGRL